MKRKAMKKIGLLSVLLLGLCACGSRSSVTKPASVFEKMVDILIENNESENEQSRVRYYQLLEHLDDPAKAKLGSLITALQKLERNRLEFDSLMTLEKNAWEEDPEGMIIADQLAVIDEFIRERHVEFGELLEEIVAANARIFGFREEDTVKFVENIRSQSHHFLVETFPITQSIYQETNQNLLSLLLLQADFFASQQIFEDALTQLAYSTGGCRVDMVFPVIFDVTNGCLSRGDTLQAKIGIGTYSSLVQPEYTRIVVNGDTLTVNDSGVALFSQRVNEMGSLTLDVQCLVVNPYNGVSATGNGQFVYDVN